MIFFSWNGRVWAQSGAGCQGEVISMTLSPSKEWVALVQERICTDGAFVTTVTNTVQLRRTIKDDSIALGRHVVDAKQSSDILTLEITRPEDRPATKWLSSQDLQITVANKSLIGLFKSKYEGVGIIIKFEPDDPTEREQWLRSRGIGKNPK
jgi:hypothetical protein